MKRVRALLLILVLASVAFGGNIEMGVVQNPPPPPDTTTTSTSAAMPELDPVTEAALALLRALLGIF